MCARLSIYWKRTARRLDASRNFPICYSLRLLSRSSVSAPIGKARQRALSTLEPGQNLGDAKKVCRLLARDNLNLLGEDTLTTPFTKFHA